jgi:isoquinoline 1-oxidoreductase beta subunit
MHRRQFVALVASGTGTLVLAACIGRRPPSEGARAWQAGAFLRIDRDGKVTLTVARAEMGQGSRTALALLVAEELDSDWNTVSVEQGDLDAKYGDQFAGGSAVVRTSWIPLRKAGAAARAMLVAAAAERWRVPAAECTTQAGAVRHPGKGRIGYGELVDAAREIPVPPDPPLKPAASFRLIGAEHSNLDHAGIVTGSIRFGIDTRVPGQLFASIERAPLFGGRVRSVDDAKARAMPGVRAVVTIDADEVPFFGDNNPGMANGVAVVADSTWAAMQARRTLVVEWDDRGGASEGTERMRTEAKVLASRPDRWSTTRGTDVATAVAAAARRVEAVYETPLLAHAPMEPMNCTALVQDGRCEVWAPSQNPEYVGVAARLITGFHPDRITVHVTRMGGAFGRRFYADFAAEAIYLAHRLQAPVQVVWTREDDLSHDFYRPAGYHLLQAGLDGSGRVTAWEHRLFNASRSAFLDAPPATGGPRNPGELSSDDYPAVLAPAFRYGYSPITSKIPRGQWRAVENSSNVFVTQSFMDELAHAAGADPLVFRLALLGSATTRTNPRSTYDPDRLLAVLRLAADQAGWGRPLTAGQGRGIAASWANETYVAHVVNVTVSDDKGVRVDRVVSAVDCGLVVHQGGARAQVEGSVVMGLSTALREGITVTGGRVDQPNFGAYPILRLREAPPIDVHFVGGGANVGGLGEPALPPVAPAFTNAIFAATGFRIRRLPIRLDGFHAA